MNTQTLPTPLLAWEAPSLPVRHRSSRWYAIAGTLVFAGVTYGIFTHTWSFTFIVALLGGTLFLLRNVSPPLHRIVLEENGFRFDHAFTAWKDCTDFWFVELPECTELHMERKSGWNREVIIQTGSMDPNLIRGTLTPFLPERPNQRERFVDALGRYLQL